MNGVRYQAANRARAGIWLVYLLLLALAACFASSMVLYLVVERIVFELLPLAAAAKTIVMLTVIGLHALALWRRLPEALRPAAWQATGERIDLVPTRTGLEVFRMVGLSFCAVAALDLWRIFSAGTQTGVVPPGGIWFMGLMLLKAGLAIGLAWSAIKIGRGRPAGESGATGDGWPAGRLPQLVHTCLRAAILATAGMLCARVLGQRFGWLSLLEIGNGTQFAAWGARLGAVVAVHLIRLPRAASRVATAGLLAEGAGRLVGGDALVVLLMLAAVFSLEWLSQPKTARRSDGRAWWNAARAAWAFCLGALAGRLAGRVLGGMLFGLFGVAGPVTGEALGMVFMALAGYLYAHSPGRSDDGRGLRHPNPPPVTAFSL